MSEGEAGLPNEVIRRLCFSGVLHDEVKVLSHFSRGRAEKGDSAVRRKRKATDLEPIHHRVMRERGQQGGRVASRGQPGFLFVPRPDSRGGSAGESGGGNVRRITEMTKGLFVWMGRAGAMAMVIAWVGMPVCEAHEPDRVPTIVSGGVVPGNGDVNEDGAVTPADAQYAYRILLGNVHPTLTQFQRADVNFNGRIDGADASTIFRAFLGKGRLPAKKFLPGDINADGKITPGDALVLYRYLYNIMTMRWGVIGAGVSSSIGGSSPDVGMIYNADATQDGFLNYQDVKRIYDIYLGRCGPGTSCGDGGAE